MDKQEKNKKFFQADQSAKLAETYIREASLELDVSKQMDAIYHAIRNLENAKAYLVSIREYKPPYTGLDPYEC